MDIAAILALPHDFGEDQCILNLLSQLEDRGWQYVDGIARIDSCSNDCTIQAFGRSKRKLERRWRYHQLERDDIRTVERIARPILYSRESEFKRPYLNNLHQTQRYRWGSSEGLIILRPDGSTTESFNKKQHYADELRDLCIARNIERILESPLAEKNPMLVKSLIARTRAQILGPYTPFTRKQE